MAAEESGAKCKETQWLHFTLVLTTLSLLIDLMFWEEAVYLNVDYFFS